MVDALTGKRVRVVRGPHRGYMGTVQHANDTHVRMELDASNKVITIKREYVDAEDSRGAGSRRAARSMQTPMRAHMTPAYVPEFARAHTPHDEYRALSVCNLRVQTHEVPKCCRAGRSIPRHLCMPPMCGQLR